MDISPFENKWKNNLDNDIYDYVIQYINNVNANVWNNKILLLIGSGYNGKTTLCNDMNKLCNNAIQIFDGKINSDIIMEEFERTQTNTIVTALSIDDIDIIFLQKVKVIPMSKTVNNFQKIDILTDLTSDSIVNAATQTIKPKPIKFIIIDEAGKSRIVTESELNRMDISTLQKLKITPIP